MTEKILRLNEDVIKGTVQDSVEKALDEPAEAEDLTKAARYKLSEHRQGYRSSHYSRNLTTTSRDATLNVPKLTAASFKTSVIER